MGAEGQELDDEPFRGTERFEVVRRLGAGGMGVVYEARDRERNARVALKTLRKLRPDSLHRFKNEFRSLRDWQHPNLVSLYELREDDGHWFFTMELVDGVPFHRHVREALEFPDDPEATIDQSPGAPSKDPTETIDPSSTQVTAEITPSAARDRRPASPRVRSRLVVPRLRRALPQLIRGVSALHDADMIHRDIKPSNIMVTDEGRLVLLDFGLVTGVADRGRRDSHLVVGTADFMAPEQAAGEKVGPAADWYAVGAVLYLALTGRPPFRGSIDRILDLKRHADPIPPGEVDPEVPPDLERLCLELLERDPAARPHGADLRLRFDLEETGERIAIPARRGPFVGRREELSRLHDAFEGSRRGRPACVFLHGESGVGKTAVVRRFVDRIEDRDPDALVLQGRCYERESVPYQAVDEIIDALSLHLAERSEAELSALRPRRAGLLAQSFPVLGRVPGFSPTAPRPAISDPQEMRAAVFAGLRELFVQRSETLPLVVVIDDLQWADADSLALLAELVRPPDAPRMTLVATVRTDAETTAPIPELPGEMQHIELAPLPRRDACELADQLLGFDADARHRAILIASVASEAGGHPLFIDALVRHQRLAGTDGAHVPLGEALWARIERRPSPERRLLELVAVAGSPLAQDLACALTREEPTEFAKLVSALRNANLLRTERGRAGETLEIYHDRVRESVLHKLSSRERTRWHRAIGRALEDAGTHGPEALAQHWGRAGDRERARGYAIEAANQAEEALAFDRAAHWYRLALDLGGERSDPHEHARLQIRLADVLANAGRGAEAADAYLAASEGAPPERALDLERRAAEQLLRSGHVSRGLELVRQVLGAVWMKLAPTPRRALLALLLRRARLRLRGFEFERRTEDEVATDRLARIDAFLSLATPLGMVDNIRGAVLQTNSLLAALSAGEPSRVARAVALEIPFVATQGSISEHRTGTLVDLSYRLAEEVDQPLPRGLARACDGVSAFLEGRWRDARDRLVAAEPIFAEQCTGALWELGTVRTFELFSLWFLGEWKEMSERVPNVVREAEDRGDIYVGTNLRSAFTNTVWLVTDDPDAARREAERSIGRWSRQGFHLQHFFDLVAHGQIHLYEGRSEDGLRYLLDRWASLEASLSPRIQLVRIFTLHLRARLALAASDRGDHEAPSRRRLAARTARKLRRERIPWARPLADLLEAACATQRGDEDRARERLRGARDAFDELDMKMFAAAALRRLGELTGDDRAVSIADDDMRAERCVRPDRITAMLAPGFARTA